MVDLGLQNKYQRRSFDILRRVFDVLNFQVYIIQCCATLKNV